MSDARPTILVADDYPENRQLFTLYLRKHYEVVTAESGEEALVRLAEAPVAAALLDLNYQGGITGFDVVEAIRANPATAALPTLALTAHASPEDRAACLARGFDAYLAKPVLKAEMLAALEQLLAARAAA
ncbi:MAG: response regulator [Bacteroidota bacterium]